MHPQQLPFDSTPGGARRSDPDTSRAAARSVDTQRVEQVVLDALKLAPAGLTTEELVDRTGLSLVTVSPRMKPLERKGLVRRGAKRANSSGRSAIVWLA
ncbi:MAG: helix-turn-helix domain-containing protein [Pyrinomonadaceae bacterium]